MADVAAAGAGSPSSGGILPAGMAGVWECNLKRSDDISPFLEVVGVPWAIRLIAKRSGVTWTIVESAGGFTQTNKNSMRTQTTSYVFGVASEIENPDGSKNMATATLVEGGSKIHLQAKTPNNLDVTTLYELQSDGSLCATINVVGPKGPIVVRRIFERK